MAATWIQVVAGLTVGVVIASLSAFAARRAYRRSPDRTDVWFSKQPWKRDDPSLVRQLAVGGILNESNWFPINTLDPCKPRDEMRAWLQTAWGIASQAAAAEAIQSLITSGHARIFDEILTRAPGKSTEALFVEIEKMFAGTLPDDGDLREFVDNHAVCMPVLHEWGYLRSPDGHGLTTRAYDLGRAVTVARVAFGAGYLSQPQAMNAISQASALAAARFGSWSQFANSYMLGRAIWGSIHDPELENMHRIVEQLQRHPESPWVRFGWF